MFPKMKNIIFLTGKNHYFYLRRAYEKKIRFPYRIARIVIFQRFLFVILSENRSIKKQKQRLFKIRNKLDI